MKVLITGISGGLGRLVAARLHALGHEVLGIDVRGWRGAPEGVRLFQTDLRKRPAEDVFRTERPDVLVHMATVSHLSHRSQERYHINLGGTQAVFDHCHTYGVKHAIFVGRHTYYGASAESPMYHTEDDPPLAMQTFPELSDLVAADLFACTALWRHADLCTTVLRLAYTLGPQHHGTLASYLRARRVPTVLGYDPLFQFIHEEDAASAIILAVQSRPRGVFNVAGPPPVPLSLLIRQTRGTNVPLPEAAIGWISGRGGFPRLPRGAVAHLKYPVVIDGARFQAQTGFQAALDDRDTMTAFAVARRVRPETD